MCVRAQTAGCAIVWDAGAIPLGPEADDERREIDPRRCQTQTVDQGLTLPDVVFAWRDAALPLAREAVA
jgi:hypothetical protein